MGWAKILEVVGDLIGVAFSLAQSAGQGDAFAQALDATLGAARARTDADLAAKHGRE